MAGIVIVSIVAMILVTSMSIIALLAVGKSTKGMDITLKTDDKSMADAYDKLMDHAIQSLPDVMKSMTKIMEDM